MTKPHHQELFGAELEFPSEAPPPRATPAPAIENNLIGTIIANRYLVHRLLGHGGMGTVYEAEHVQLRKRVALKVLHSHLSVRPQVQARFEREAIAAGRISHPSVAAATDFGRLPDGSFYLVLEHVDGESLAEVLSQCGRLPVDRAFRIMVQICSALSAAHAQGIVHRDLKPDNIMLVVTEDDDQVKVLDFGIAKIQMDEDESHRLTKQGLVFGTPEYMSPEQARGTGVDHRTDLYALGMIAYEMVAGRSAFWGSDMLAILTAQMSDPPPPLPANVPLPFSRLISSLLEKEPDDRPQSADELFEQLTVLSEELQISMPVPRTLTARRFLQGVGARPLGSTALASIRVLSMRPPATYGLPLWVPLVALLAGTAIGAFFVLRQAPNSALSRPPHEESAAPVVASSTSASPPEKVLLRRAGAGDRDALGAVRKLVERDRSILSAGAAGSDLVDAQVARLLALARGYSEIRHYSGVLSASADAVALDPALKQNEELLLEVRLALGQRDAVEEGLAFALTLGEPGADMIYDLWTVQRGRPGKTPVVARAMNLVRGGELEPIASDALKIAMQLEAARVCEQYEPLLARATQLADTRSVPTLKALRSTKGCGSDAASDCFPCLRAHEAELEQAISSASHRKGPAFLAKAAQLEN